MICLAALESVAGGKGVVGEPPVHSGPQERTREGAGGRAEVLAKQDVGEWALPVTERFNLLGFGESEEDRSKSSGRIIIHRKDWQERARVPS